MLDIFRNLHLAPVFTVHALLLVLLQVGTHAMCVYLSEWFRLQPAMHFSILVALEKFSTAPSASNCFVTAVFNLVPRKQVLSFTRKMHTRSPFIAQSGFSLFASQKIK